MEVGKVPNEILQKIIIDKIKCRREEVLIRPGIGEDCCAVEFGDYACVLSTDPITGAVKDIGRLAVHISCNDVASCGVDPLGLMVTILAPPEITEHDLECIMQQISETAGELNVEIIGGHTEVTNAVNRVVISSTALGRVIKDKLVKTAGARPGDCLIMTKTAGLEGTAIIAGDLEQEVSEILGKEAAENAKRLVHSISVVKEGVIAGKTGATAMHDVTEGGILGAVWELCEASGAGAVVYKDRIPLLPETVAICRHFKLDPFHLISSGCMLIACQDGEKMLEALQKGNIQAAIIGKVTEDKGRFLVDGGSWNVIEPPAADELYKVI